MGWLYKETEFELPENATHKDIYGFVYIIENLVTDKKYIGKKFFWSSKTRMVKKKKKRYKGESDWKTYYGSSEKLLEDIAKYGKESFRREILHICKSKGECSYKEAEEQFNRGVLLSDSYYNSWISVKIRSNHVNGLKNGLHSDENSI